MDDRTVRVFFYGSFINRDVLAEVGLIPRDVDVARAWGFDLRIGPLANLVPSERDSVYGIVCRATHAELARLYAQDWVGTYLPEAVIVETRRGGILPALCYVAPSTRHVPASGDYIDRIAGPARDYGFPDWYVERIESFREETRKC
jgi:hypothetical protein